MAKRYLVISTVQLIDPDVPGSISTAINSALAARGAGKRAEILTHDEAFARKLLDLPMQDLRALADEIEQVSWDEGRAASKERRGW